MRRGHPAREAGSDGTAASLLRILEQSRGSELSIKEIEGQIENSLHRRPLRRGRSRSYIGYRKSQPKAVNSQSIRQLIAELERMGAVAVSKNHLTAGQPFLLSGRISLSPHGAGFVKLTNSPERGEDIFIPSRLTRNALPGDQVALRLKDKRGERFEGMVVSILKRSRREFRMKLLPPRSPRTILGKVLDLDGGHILALVESFQLSPEEKRRLAPGLVLIVSLNGRKRREMGVNFHEAKFLRFEKDSNTDTDLARILMKYNLDLAYPSFKAPSRTSRQAPSRAAASASGRDRESSAGRDLEPYQKRVIQEPSAATVMDWKGRRDLRELYTITIDGENSKDFDDALSLVPKGKRSALLYVHIADVSYYVRKDSALDQEALRRGTSCYLLNSVIPMLPPDLSENLCSLIAGRNRLAVTAEMEVSLKNGKIRQAKFYRSIIRVDKRLTYAGAEGKLERALQRENSQPPKTERGHLQELQGERYEEALLAQLWHLADLQRQRRRAAGKIEIDIPESRVVMGAGQRVKGIVRYHRPRSSILIEECMLSANSSVAAWLKANKAYTLYRVHEQMEPEKIKALNAFCEAFNIAFALKDSSPSSMKRLMAAVDARIDQKKLRHIFQLQLLRSFQQAYYSPHPNGHWGLAFEDYCHFTSPIRRYPDLVVHRSLVSLIEKQKAPYSASEVEQIAIKSSEAERQAVEAERDILRLKVIRYIEQEKITRIEGILSNFKGDRIFIDLEEYPMEAVVEARHLMEEGELIPIDNYAFFLSKRGQPARIGERWKLEIERLDEEELRIFCRPVWQESDPKQT